MLFFDILAWVWLAYALTAGAALTYLRRKTGYDFQLHGHAIPVTGIAIIWLVARWLS